MRNERHHPREGRRNEPVRGGRRGTTRAIFFSTLCVALGCGGTTEEPSNGGGGFAGAAGTGGGVLSISARHPTADGRTFGDLRVSDRLDGIGVESVEIVPYPFAHTYDILPASSSGAYYAGGALIGSTLSPTFSSACSR